MENKRKLNVKLSEICEVLGVECPIEDRVITKIAHIRRNVEEGCVYFAFKNWRVDTYANIDYAIESGAAMIVTEKKIEDYPCVVVEDALAGFMKIASWYRDSLEIDVIGITGSIGKTSTKEMVYSTLGIQNEGLIEKNIENANSSDLAAMNLFDLGENTKILVQEMAIQDIKASSHAIIPTYAIITNIGVSHIEEFGSREEIYRHKLEVLDGMKEGKVFLNIDDDLLCNFAKVCDRECITYALENEEADCRASNIQQSENGYKFIIHYKGRKKTAQTSCLGKHNVLNALVAFALGCEMKMDETSLIEGIKNYKPTGYRQNIIQVGEVTILADCFNAAPNSMKAALDTLESMDTACKKIAVLGDMLEMGEYSKEFHEEIGRYINSKNIDHLICYGNESKYICDVVDNKQINISHTIHRKDLIQAIKEATEEKSVILFKASHGMMLEEIIDKVFKTSLGGDELKSIYIWDLVEREGKDIKEYLRLRSCNTVAVYGLTYNGENLIEYLNRKDVSMVYAIDKRAKYAPSKSYPYPVYTLQDELPAVDAVIISYYSNEEEIVKSIKNIMDTTCIPYRKIVREILEL